MKKLFALLLATVMLLSAASALAQTKLTVWCWDPAFNIYAMEEAKKVYAQINPDVEIEVIETLSGDCETRQTTALSSGQTDTLPDIVLMQDNSGRRFLDTFPGAYFPMDGLVDYDNFATYKIDKFTSGGKRYAVPFDNGVAATFVRTDYLEAAGFTLADLTDITWDRFIEIGLKVKEATGNYMLVTQAGYADFVSMMTQSADFWFFDDEGHPNINTNPAVRAMVETIVKLHDSGIVKEAVDWSEYIASFNNGSAGSTIQGCWIIGSIVLAKDQAGKWGVTNIPRLDIESGTNYSSQGGSSWVVPASSKNPEAAVDFLSKTFGASVEFYQTILQSSGAIATYLPAADGPAYSEPHPFFNGQKVFEDLMNYSSKVPLVKYGVYNYEARDEIVNAIEAIFNGASIDTALNDAQSAIEFIME
ncbi:MAG: extracellular solute-binding protein [Bacillota bacterium]|nr:extracellular solute-binding protein [Bacillota bacterium]